MAQAKENNDRFKERYPGRNPWHPTWVPFGFDNLPDMLAKQDEREMLAKQDSSKG